MLRSSFSLRRLSRNHYARPWGLIRCTAALSGVLCGTRVLALSTVVCGRRETLPPAGVLLRHRGLACRDDCRFRPLLARRRPSRQRRERSRVDLVPYLELALVLRRRLPGHSLPLLQRLLQLRPARLVPFELRAERLRLILELLAGRLALVLGLLQVPEHLVPVRRHPLKLRRSPLRRLHVAGRLLPQLQHLRPQLRRHAPRRRRLRLGLAQLSLDGPQLFLARREGRLELGLGLRLRRGLVNLTRRRGCLVNELSPQLLTRRLGAAPCLARCR
mmetsp:Transcript_55279/g.125669  ORF Transcript_55279/g.125669 Transcript_55279/m.125669 type:complete len:274 (+) Transcript_55279:249-1070(+)